MRKALLIEDDPDTRQIYRLLLQHSGWSVVDALTAAQGIQLAATHRPDLVILDLGLPKVSGMDIIQTLRAAHDAPIIVVSGHEDAEAEVRRLGAAAFVLKPFDPFDELLPLINTVMGE